MSASCCSSLGKLVSSSSALRFLRLVEHLPQLLGGAGVAAHRQRGARRRMMTKPQDSTGWLTGTRLHRVGADLEGAAGLEGLDRSTGFFARGDAR